MTDIPHDLPAKAFSKIDTGNDADFYAVPRLVTHIDEAATRALTAFYARRLQPGDAVLDLMSSWVSHLPEGIQLGDVVGHGMNADEMAANPRLDRWFLQDLNRKPELPLPDAAFDAVLCCVGVQYLQKPVAVFADVRRILKPNGIVIVSFSNRCFPTKAIAAWRSLDLGGQAALVRLYLERAGFASIETELVCDGRNSDPLVCVTGRM